jgi:aryl-alcohol dehydrogenase-like predicted oxidoreductase
MVRRGVYGVDDARRSLEESLRSLQTDHIDVFLMHEGGAEDCTPDLLAFLEDRQRAGVISRFGVGSEFSKVNQVATRQQQFAGVLQFENSILKANSQQLPRGSSSLFITHGALGQSFREVEQAVAADAAFRDLCSTLLGADVMQQDILAAAMLCWARQNNPEGSILFSSRSKRRVAAAAAALKQPAFAGDQMARFADGIWNHLVAACAPE